MEGEKVRIEVPGEEDIMDALGEEISSMLMQVLTIHEPSACLPCQ
jgi:hypothetical protein